MSTTHWNNYPYTDFHELNLDWILNTIKTLETKVEDWTIFSEIKFSDPIDWNMGKYYPKNTIVLGGNGNTYLSKDNVPVGVELDNDKYWMLIGNYNAQVEQLQDAVDEMQIKVANIVKNYPDVDTMKRDIDLSVGVICYCAGFYSSDDGGGAFYHITNESGAFSHNIDNGLFATLIFENTMNVKQFGAIGDGVTDDTEHFNTCLTLCRNIVINKGNYVIDNISIPSNTIINAYGATLHKIGSYRLCVVISLVDNVIINGLEVIGDKTTFTDFAENRHCFYIQNSTNVTLKDCVGRNAKGDGLGSNAQGTIEGDTEIYTDNINIINCIFSNNYRNGISLVGGKKWLIEGCRCIENGGTNPMAGIDIEPNYDYQWGDITIRDFYTSKNYNSGIQLAFGSTDRSTTVRGINNILIDGWTSFQDGINSASRSPLLVNNAGNYKGTAKVINSSIIKPSSLNVIDLKGLFLNGIHFITENLSLIECVNKTALVSYESVSTETTKEGNFDLEFNAIQCSNVQYEFNVIQAQIGKLVTGYITNNGNHYPVNIPQEEFVNIYRRETFGMFFGGVNINGSLKPTVSHNGIASTKVSTGVYRVVLPKLFTQAGYNNSIIFNCTPTYGRAVSPSIVVDESDMSITVTMTSTAGTPLDSSFDFIAFINPGGTHNILGFKDVLNSI